jgi:hypothetical protein
MMCYGGRDVDCVSKLIEAEQSEDKCQRGTKNGWHNG